MTPTDPANRMTSDYVDAVERFQCRVGRELHNTITQQIAGASMIAEGLRQNLAGLDLAQTERAASLVDILKEATCQVRQLSRQLMPVEFDPFGLMGALDELAEETARRFAIDCQFEARQQVFIKNPAFATHLFRIAEESVNNAVLHAQANSVWISLNQTPEIELTVRDDGNGFVVEEVLNDKGGLYVMRCRASVCRATLHIDSRLGHGTEIICRLPCEDLDV